MNTEIASISDQSSKKVKFTTEEIDMVLPNSAFINGIVVSVGDTSSCKKTDPGKR